MAVDQIPITEIAVGIPGPAGAGVTASEKSSIVARLAALEAIVDPATGNVNTGAGSLTVGGPTNLNGSTTNIGNATADTVTFTAHEEGAGSAPSIAANAAAGTGATATIMWGNDTRGLIRVVVGTSPIAGNFFTVTHFVARNSSNYVVLLNPADDSAAAATGRVFVNKDAVTTTFWTAKASSAPSAGVTYYYFYWLRG